MPRELVVIAIVLVVVLVIALVEARKLGRCGLSQDELARRLRGEE